MPKIRPDWAQRITDARLSKGYSQRQFCEKMGINQSSLVYYETGKRLPKIDFLIKLIQLTDVNGNWLLTGEGEMSGQPDDKIQAAFPGVPINDNFMEVYRLLSDPEISDVFVLQFLIFFRTDFKEIQPRLYKFFKEKLEKKAKREEQERPIVQ